MFADGRTVPPGEEVSTEVCIVGAGPAGITLARSLAAENIDVVLLERGGSTGTGTRENLDNAVNVGIPYRVDKARGTGFGGALHKWLVTTPLGDGFGRLREFAPDDFAVRPWIPDSGWPFEKAELAPYYQRARRWFDVPWPSENPEPDWDERLAVSSICDSRQDPIRSEVFAFANPGVFAADYRRQLDHSERALVLTHSTAVNLCTEEADGPVSSVEVSTEAGRFRVSSPVVVLTAGAIENARLLLASRDHDPAGIGNAHDLVGRYFMEHPRFTSGLIEPSTRLLADDTAWDIHLLGDVPVQRKFRLAPEVARRERLANNVFFLRRSSWTPAFTAARRSLRHYRAIIGAQELKSSAAVRRIPPGPFRRVGDVLLGLDAFVRSSPPPRDDPDGKSRDDETPAPLTIEVMAEQRPNALSRVTLHSSERDRFGVPKAVVDWRLTADDLRGVVRGQQLLAEHLVAKGLGSVHSLLRAEHLPLHLQSADHQMGTTRMARDPRKGVVDEHGAVHGSRNVYVAGPSVFPTGGDANPTLTTVAMALRLSDHLLARIRH